MKGQKIRNAVNISAWTLIGLVPILLILSSLGAHMEYPAEGAQQLLNIAIKECALKTAQGDANPVFSSGNPTRYKIIPEDRSCSGDDNGVISAISSDKEKYPNYFISATPPYRKSCSHSGKSEELYGCSARKNGTW